MLTPAQAAELLGVSPDTVRVWARRGDLGTVETSPSGYRRYRFDQDEVEAFGARRRQMRSLLATVYLLRDSDDAVLYVGCITRTTRRLGEHHDKDWWPSVASASFEHFPDRAAAYRREAKLIAAHRPRFNTQGVT